MDNELLIRLSSYLNDYSDSITLDMMNSMLSSNISNKEAYILLLFSFLNYDIDTNKDIYSYFKDMVNELDINKYLNNSYYKNIKIDNIKEDNIQYKELTLKPYEAFVCDDFKNINNVVLPQIGYFKDEYKYPAILEDDRIWMLITPNEIETMDKVINEVKGNILTYGLGLGYFPYMVSLKDNVSNITIVEKDKNVIRLFEKYILPQFIYKNKITIINDDAFNYEVNRKQKYDYIFTDLWHDVGDGLSLYKKMKELEKDGIYLYWIEDTMKYYM